MKNIIYGVKKTEEHCVFIVAKNYDVIQKICDFIILLGFEKHYANKIYSPLGNADNNYSSKKYSSRIYTDKLFHFDNKDYKIDIIFGHKRIVISIYTKEDRQIELTNKLLNFFMWSNEEPETLEVSGSSTN